VCHAIQSSSFPFVPSWPCLQAGDLSTERLPPSEDRLPDVGALQKALRLWFGALRMRSVFALSFQQAAPLDASADVGAVSAR